MGLTSRYLLLGKPSDKQSRLTGRIADTKATKCHCGQTNNSYLSEAAVGNNVSVTFPGCTKLPHHDSLTAGILFFMYLTTVCLGGYCFHRLELPRERIERARMNAVQVAFLKTHSCVSIGDLNVFVKQVIRAAQMGIIPHDMKNMSQYESVVIPTDKPIDFDHPSYIGTRSTISKIAEAELEEAELWSGNWNMDKSIFFSVTVATTIGYGKVSPVTISGKVFCIFFACIAIPITLAFAEALIKVCMVQVRIWQERFVDRLYMSQCVRNNSATLAPANIPDDQSSVAWAYESTQAIRNCSQSNSAEQTAHFQLEADEEGNEPHDSSGIPTQRNAFRMESAFVTANRSSTTTSTIVVNDREFRAPLGDNEMHRRNGDSSSSLCYKIPTKSERTCTTLSGLNPAKSTSCPNLRASTQTFLAPRIRYIEEKDNSCSTISDENLRSIQRPTNLNRSTLGYPPDSRLVTISKRYSQETGSSLDNQEVSIHPTQRISGATDLELLEIRNHSVTSSRVSAPETFCLELVTLLLTKFDCGQTTGASTFSGRLEKRQKCVRRIRLLHSCLIFIFILIATIILPSVIFHHTEKGWSFLDAVYFCVISMTSVGLGDLVPSGYETIEESRSPTVLYLKRIFNVMTTIYLLFGTILILLGVRVIEDAICSERNAVSRQTLLIRDPTTGVYNSGNAFESGQPDVTSAPNNFIRRGRSNTDVSITKKKPQAEPLPGEKTSNNSPS